MRIFSNLHSAVRAIGDSWQRSTLTSLGVMVGVVAIVLLIGIGRGVQKDLTGQVKDLGVNVVVVFPARIDLSAMSMNPNLGGQSYLKPEHARALERTDGVVRTALLTFTGGGIKRGEAETFPLTLAAEPSWFQMHPIQIERGRLFGPGDGDRPVAVLGGIAARDLFGEGDPVGQDVKINGKVYTVVGVTKDEQSENSLFRMASFENVVYVPWAGFKKLNPNAQIDRIMVQSKPEAEPKKLVADLETKLGGMLDAQQFSVFTQEQILGLVYRMMNILTWLLTGLTSIALFVGGVGIMAIMLMSVNARTREIGIRKTVGAHPRDIFWQFLFEAIVLALAGGLVGLALSAAVSLYLTQNTAIRPEISPELITFALGISTLTGAGFGLIPALNAARKDPVEAMRQEE